MKWKLVCDKCSSDAVAVTVNGDSGVEVVWWRWDMEMGKSQ